MDCSSRECVAVMETEGEQESPSSLPMKLFLLGFLLMFAGVVVIMASALLEGDANVSGGAVIFVGPIPIILGSGPNAFLAVILAAVLTIIGFIVFLWMRKQFPKG
jgi:uncharacterized membrane protein